MEEQLLAGLRMHMNKNKSALVQVMFETLDLLHGFPKLPDPQVPQSFWRTVHAMLHTKETSPSESNRIMCIKSLIMLEAIHNSCELTVSTAVRDLVRIRQELSGVSSFETPLMQNWSMRSGSRYDLETWKSWRSVDWSGRKNLRLCNQQIIDGNAYKVGSDSLVTWLVYGKRGCSGVY